MNDMRNQKRARRSSSNRNAGATANGAGGSAAISKRADDEKEN